MPPPLGYGMGVTFYSWSSDQLSQYGTKFVPVTVRDSTYVLDEICNNETELPIRVHGALRADSSSVNPVLRGRLVGRLRRTYPRLITSPSS